ncbi:MAG: hypothetical protein FWB77_05820 [Treponema sp.]|nr:hypothetical protein [Treponema sp.]
MSGSGKGGNNRKNRQGLQGKQRFSGRRDEPQKHSKKNTTLSNGDNLFSDGKFEKNKMSMHERPQWTAPELPENPITTPDCVWCGKPIKDITTAISDKESGRPVHFDCVLTRIGEMEHLELNDSVCYIGGGRFGIIHYNNPPDTRDFSIKKIFEWEVKEKEKDSEWRRPISEYFSIT